MPKKTGVLNTTLHSRIHTKQSWQVEVIHAFKLLQYKH